MLRVCVKAVEILRKAFGQVRNFCTVSTVWLNSAVWFRSFSTFPDTDFAQILSSFTQPVLVNFNLLGLVFCPVSTPPINTTKLIKE
jgi:hypothetical protein